MHDLSFSSVSSPTSPFPSPDLQDHSLLDPDYKDVLGEVVHGAIIAPSLFLSEGGMLLEDESPKDAPHDRVDTPQVEDDKLLSVCVHDSSPTKESLEEIPLIELDGSYEGKK